MFFRFMRIFLQYQQVLSDENSDNDDLNLLIRWYKNEYPEELTHFQEAAHRDQQKN